MENQEQVNPTEVVKTNELNSGTKPKNTNGGKIFLSIIFYLLGVALIVVCIMYLSNDLQPEYSFERMYYFKQKEYVGGDAYNYIISAARSTAIMVKALVYAVLGCTSLILGQLINKK